MNTHSIPSYDRYRGDSLPIPFQLLTLGTAERNPGAFNSAELHRHNYHEIFYFIKGGGWHDIDFRRHAIDDHALHFVNPGQVHMMRRAPESHGFILLFTPEFYLRELPESERFASMWYLTHSLPNPIVQPGAHEREPLEAVLRMLHAEYESDGSHRERMLHTCLDMLLLMALRMFERSEAAHEWADSAHGLVNRLRTLIEAHFTATHAPRDFATMLHVSQNHLNSSVRKVLGRTIGALVQERIVLEAQRLLYHTELSIKEIAFRLNFEDPSYFTRFFRKHVGTAPNEFRDASRRKHH